MHISGVTIEKARYKRRPGRREELLLDNDKPHITLHVELYRWLVRLLPSSKTRKNVAPKSKYALNS